MLDFLKFFEDVEDAGVVGDGFGEVVDEFMVV